MWRGFAVFILATIGVGAAEARPVETSLRPIARANALPEVSRSAVQLAAVTIAAPRNSLRPTLRPVVRSGRSVPIETVPVSTQAGFDRWIAQFRIRALRQGISPRVFDTALRGAMYDPEVIRRDRNQSEFTKTVWDYLDSAASDARIRNGKSALRKNKALLDRIEARYGVDQEVVVAIWGLESAYGTFRGKKPVIGSLATLAYDARRSAFFEEQLVEALRILQAGEVSQRNFVGSWAGAMGHTQFIPTSYQSLAVDFDGNGRRDIWSDDPADALASTANYLAKNGWRKGVPWGVEVTLPRNFDALQANREIKRMPSEWARLGVVGVNGKPVREFGSASVLLPAGARGAAFLIFQNFDVIETYNTADAYVIGVGHLADRIMGGKAIQSGWPREDRALTLKERLELQRLLTKRGFDTKKIDGKIGPLTINAVRAFQQSIGEIPDGYASLHILRKLK